MWSILAVSACIQGCSVICFIDSLFVGSSYSIEVSRSFKSAEKNSFPLTFVFEWVYQNRFALSCVMHLYNGSEEWAEAKGGWAATIMNRIIAAANKSQFLPSYFLFKWIWKRVGSRNFWFEWCIRVIYFKVLLRFCYILLIQNIIIMHRGRDKDLWIIVI